MANQLVGKQSMGVIARLLEDATFQYFCLVDSAENVEQLGAFFRAQRKRLNVLIEVGVDGGRTGVRDRRQLETLVEALGRWHDAIWISGVELYEGVLEEEASIRAFLRRAIEVARELADGTRFDQSPFLLSGAGSAWYDVVAEELSSAKTGAPFEVVLRPGCYLTHDVGVYRTAQKKIRTRNPVARQMQCDLTPALQIWAYVQSVPERRKAIIAMGKRDAAFDAGLPTPALHFRPGEPSPHPAAPTWELTKMMDQHAYLRIEDGDDIRAGDMIGFDISHPCLTFDKWRCLCVLDEEYRVIEVLATFF
jgi:D-serine dehydratase